MLIYALYLYICISNVQVFMSAMTVCQCSILRVDLTSTARSAGNYYQMIMDQIKLDRAGFAGI